MNRRIVSTGFQSLSTTRVSQRGSLPFLAATHNQHRLSHQSYGGGEGDPKGENPQEQGSNPSADQEHPGPPPPAEGQGSGGGPTKAATDSGQNTKHNASSSGGDSGKESKSKSGAQPKILNEGVPTELSDDAKQHNKEMANRYDQAGATVVGLEDDKVGKEFWAGEMAFIQHVDKRKSSDDPPRPWWC